MIGSIDGMIVRREMLVRRGIARMETLIRGLRRYAHELSDILVIYNEQGRPVRLPAVEFLRRQADSLPLREGKTCT